MTHPAKATTRPSAATADSSPSPRSPPTSSKATATVIWMSSCTTGWPTRWSVRVSQHPVGETDGDSKDPYIDGDGRFVVFQLDGHQSRVRRRQHQRGHLVLRSVPATRSTKVSERPGPVLSEGYSRLPAISADGRHVVFSSRDTELVAGDTNGTQDVFVRDLQTWAIERVSVSTEGAESNGWNGEAAISSDGTVVAWWSNATNLVDGDDNAQRDIFVRDRVAGTTTRVNVSSAGEQAVARISWQVTHHRRRPFRGLSVGRVESRRRRRQRHQRRLFARPPHRHHPAAQPDRLPVRGATPTAAVRPSARTASTSPSTQRPRTSSTAMTIWNRTSFSPGARRWSWRTASSRLIALDGRQKWVHATPTESTPDAFHSYSCAQGFVALDINQFTFTDHGAQISAGGSLPTVLVGHLRTAAAESFRTQPRLAGPAPRSTRSRALHRCRHLDRVVFGDFHRSTCGDCTDQVFQVSGPAEHGSGICELPSRTWPIVCWPLGSLSERRRRPRSNPFNLLKAVTVDGGDGLNDEARGSDRRLTAGNVFVTGYVTIAGHGRDIWLARYDSDLVLQDSVTHRRARERRRRRLLRWPLTAKDFSTSSAI